MGDAGYDDELEMELRRANCDDDPLIAEYQDKIARLTAKLAEVERLSARRKYDLDQLIRILALAESVVAAAERVREFQRRIDKAEAGDPICTDPIVDYAENELDRLLATYAKTSPPTDPEPKEQR